MKQVIIKRNGFTIRSARTYERYYVNLDGKRIETFYCKRDALEWCESHDAESERKYIKLLAS